MALKVKCKCGTMLKVPSAMADKRVTCPGCKKGFILPAAKFAALGGAAKPSAAAPSRAATASPASSQIAPAPITTAASLPTNPPDSALGASGASADPTELDLTPSNLDLELAPSSDDLLGDLKLAGGDPEPLPAVNPESVAPALYAADAGIRSASKRLTNDPAGPKRGYWSDAIHSFYYPFQSTGNLITFAIIAAIDCINIVLGHVGPYGLIPSLIIFGWIRAVYLNVVQETATGSEDLPGVKMEDGFLEDIVKPAFRYIGAYACSLLPTAAFLIAMATGVVPASQGTVVYLLGWLAVGIFLWPMFVILFSFNAVSHVIRIDLIFSTIFKAFLPYLAMWLMLMVVGLSAILPLIAWVVSTMDLNVKVPQLPQAPGALGQAAMIALDVYFSIVSMRIIGLYYLHFKRRFTMTFE